MSKNAISQKLSEAILNNFTNENILQISDSLENLLLQLETLDTLNKSLHPFFVLQSTINGAIRSAYDELSEIKKAPTGSRQTTVGAKI